MARIEGRRPDQRRGGARKGEFDDVGTSPARVSPSGHRPACRNETGQVPQASAPRLVNIDERFPVDDDVTASRRLSHMSAAAVASLLLLLGLSACTSSEDAASNDGATSTTAGDVDLGSARLLGPAEFAPYLEENPTVPLVNVHTPYEGHLEGTDASVPFEEIGSWADLPEDRSAPIVLYCRSGRMSGIAADTLTEMGYTDIVDLDGGMNAWTEAGYRLLTDPPPGAG